jgi:hypothetical protein
LHAYEVSILSMPIDRREYWTACARGWDTGLCRTPQEALERIVAWFAGDEIPEAPVGQASVAVMEALRDHLASGASDPRLSPRGDHPHLCVVEGALAAGLNTGEWLWVSSIVEIYSGALTEVAPPAMLRRVV